MNATQLWTNYSPPHITKLQRLLDSQIKQTPPRTPDELMQLVSRVEKTFTIAIENLTLMKRLVH